MNSLESLTEGWSEHVWPQLLAFTLAIAVVLVLRRPCRRVFGAERSFQLWWLVPSTMLASQLPHADGMRIVVLPAIVHGMTAVGTWHTNVMERGTTWQACLLVAWLVGVMLTLSGAMLAQHRYRVRLRGATRVTHADMPWPLWRAATAGIGPAMVGAWRPRIVVPVDFDSRYDKVERALILAHECMHARRRDGWWSLCAQVLIAMFWFHPFAWLGWKVFRHDQELACDAAVMLEHGTQRRSYANAMLKTLGATMLLPIGCNWSSRHPITERIAMLTRQMPNRRCKSAGAIFLFATTTGLTGLVYAATQHSVITPDKQAGYQLALVVSRGGQTLAQSTLCTNGGEAAKILQNGLDGVGTWQFTFTVRAAEARQVQVDVDGSVDQSGHVATAKPSLKGPLGQPMLVKIGGTEGKAMPLQLAITPTEGCAAASRQTSVSQRAKDGHSRDAA